MASVDCFRKQWFRQYNTTFQSEKRAFDRLSQVFLKIWRRVVIWRRVPAADWLPYLCASSGPTYVTRGRHWDDSSDKVHRMRKPRPEWRILAYSRDSLTAPEVQFNSPSVSCALWSSPSILAPSGPRGVTLIYTPMSQRNWGRLGRDRTLLIRLKQSKYYWNIRSTFPVWCVGLEQWNKHPISNWHPSPVCLVIINSGRERCFLWITHRRRFSSLMHPQAPSQHPLIRQPYWRHCKPLFCGPPLLKQHRGDADVTFCWNISLWQFKNWVSLHP